jgi:hypothetical protein
MRYSDLVNWVNKEFERFEIYDYEAISAERTYHSQDAIEGGACRMLIFFKHKEFNGFNNYFLCFYTLKQLNEHLKSGYEMYLNFDRNLILTNATIELRKK